MGDKEITIYTSFKCSLNCSYCFQKRDDFITYKNSDYNSYRQPSILLRFLKPPKGTLYKDTFYTRIAFVGGECLEEPYIIKSCLEACKIYEGWHNYKFVFVTNGKKLLDDEIKEILKLASSLGEVMIKLSFDNEKKKPQLLNEDIYEFLKDNYYHNAYYVIKDKNSIKFDVDNIKFLNKYGINPLINYNMYTRYELFEASTKKEFVNLLNKINYARDFGKKDICNGIYILPNGEITRCHKYHQNNSKDIENNIKKCQKCAYLNKCNICPKEQSDSLCELKKILYEEYIKKHNI